MSGILSDHPPYLDICLLPCLSVWPFCLNDYPACHPVYLDICMVHWLSTSLTIHHILISCYYPVCLSDNSAWMTIPPVTLSTSISDWYPTYRSVWPFYMSWYLPTSLHIYLSILPERLPHLSPCLPGYLMNNLSTWFIPRYLYIHDLNYFLTRYFTT